MLGLNLDWLYLAISAKMPCLINIHFPSDLELSEDFASSPSGGDEGKLKVTCKKNKRPLKVIYCFLK